MKHCNSCHADLPNSAFSKNRATCNPCRGAQDRRRREGRKSEPRPSYKPINNPPEMDYWLYKVTGYISTHRADELVNQWQLNKNDPR